MNFKPFIYFFISLILGLCFLLVLGHTGRLDLIATIGFLALSMGVLVYVVKGYSVETDTDQSQDRSAIRFVLYLIITISSFWGVWLPFPHSANDSPYPFHSAFDLRSVRPPQAWRAAGSDGLGFYTLDTQWSWASDFLVFFMVKNLRLDFWMVAQLIFIFGGLLVSYIGTSFLQKRFGIGYWPSLVGSIFFALNSYIILLIDGGQLSLALAYSLLPLCFYYFVSVVDHMTSLSLLRFVVFSLVLSIFDIRFIYLLILLISIFFIFYPNVKKFITIGLITGVIFFAFHFYWIFPSIQSSQSGLPATYTQANQLELLNFSSLSHSIFFSQPHWSQNLFGHISKPLFFFVFIPILVFAAPILARRPTKNIGLWLVIAVIFIYLSKGYQPPFKEGYSWLFEWFPGFFLFRDSTKFMAIQALAYSMLLGFSAHYLFLINKKIIAPIILYLLLSIYPVYSGRLNGMFARHPQEKDYLEFAQVVEGDNKFGRIVWLPSISQLGVANRLHPAVDALALANKRPFATGSIGKYESTNFIRDNSYMDKLFDIASVQYLVIPPPFDRPTIPSTSDQKKYFETLVHQYSNLSWLEKETHLKIPVFKTKKYQDHFFVTKKTEYILGSMEDYFLSQKDLSSTAAIFLENQTNQDTLIDDHLGKVVLQDKTLLDFTASLIPSQYFLFPSTQLSSSPPTLQDWWKRGSEDYVWLRDFLEQKYSLTTSDLDFGGGWAIAEGDAKLALTLPECASNCELLIRLMHSPKSESLIVEGSGLAYTIPTRNFESKLQTRVIAGDPQSPAQKFTYPKAAFFWHRVGTFPSRSTITLKSTGQINIANALAFVPSGYWKELNDLSQSLISAAPTSNESIPATVTHARMSPSKYVVNVTNLKRPFVLAFSENYSPLWEANGEKSTQLYGFINGFLIDSPGEYVITISNQSMVNIGMISTAVCVIILIGWWMKAGSSDKIKKYERKDI